MAMSILLTGASGFLGQHIRHEFATNHPTTNLLTPSSKQLNVLDYDGLYAYLLDQRPDKIIHAAALCGGIKKNSESPADFLHQNTQMALNIYEAARAANINYILGLGSVCMYGLIPPHIPFIEDDIWSSYPEKTNGMYGIAKRVLMLCSQSYRQQYGIRGCFLVPANLMGQFDHFDLEHSHVIPALIRKFDDAAQNSKPFVEVWGNRGSGVSREFLYAGDLAEVLAKAAVSSFDHPEPINIGTGVETTIDSLIELIARMTGFRGEVRYNGKLDGQPKRVLNVDRAKELLGFQAKTSLKDGLAKTIQWYQEHKVEILAREEKK
jgi:GDP-L-fucose synthase